jgi:hypothetical protein
VSLYIQAVKEKIMVLSELQRKGAMAILLGCSICSVRQGTIPRLKAVLPVLSWRKPGRMQLRCTMQLRIAWMDGHPKAKEF